MEAEVHRETVAHLPVEEAGADLVQPWATTLRPLHRQAHPASSRLEMAPRWPSRPRGPYLWGICPSGTAWQQHWFRRTAGTKPLYLARPSRYPWEVT